MNIRELKSKWNKEKEFYRIQEIGSGVQSFIKSCLESQELFNLKEGLLGARINARNNEFIQEKKAMESRRADFYIYINSEIAIPSEVECFGNINNGIKQLFNYQNDFKKQYGILTDGFQWRFYNNNIYREFSLNYIFENTELFIRYWKEYIKKESYYKSFFEPLGQQSLFDSEIKLYVEENLQIFLEDIKKLIKLFQEILRVEGYFNIEDKKDEKRAAEITYALY